MYGPTTAPDKDDIQEVEEEIYECIRVTHPDFSRASLPELIL